MLCLERWLVNRRVGLLHFGVGFVAANNLTVSCLLLGGRAHLNRICVASLAIRTYLNRHFDGCATDHIGQFKRFIDAVVCLSVLCTPIYEFVCRSLGSHLTDILLVTRVRLVCNRCHRRSRLVVFDAAARLSRHRTAHTRNGLHWVRSCLKVADTCEIERFHKLFFSHALGRVLKRNHSIVSQLYLHVGLLSSAHGAGSLALLLGTGEAAHDAKLHRLCQFLLPGHVDGALAGHSLLLRDHFVVHCVLGDRTSNKAHPCAFLRRRWRSLRARLLVDTTLGSLRARASWCL